MKNFYNGYVFHLRQKEPLFNTDMVFHYLKQIRHGENPEQLIDTNVASDYRKIKNLFSIAPPEISGSVLEKLLHEGYASAEIVEEFSLEKRFESQDLISLLFYTGIITIRDGAFGVTNFVIPNYVIKALYYEYFIRIKAELAGYDFEANRIALAIRDMAADANIRPLVDEAEGLLKKLSRRDYRNFDEKYIKLIFVTYFMMTSVYFVYSELEDESGYKDITCIGRDVYDVRNHFILEIKYLKKKDASRLEEVKRQGIEQLKSYRVTANYKGQLHKVLIIFTGAQCKVCSFIS
jgi:hypothetical protein